MQLLTSDSTMFLKKKKFAHENMKKPPPKVTHNQPKYFFSVLPTGLKIAHRTTYVTLVRAWKKHYLWYFRFFFKPVTSRNPLSDTIGSVLIWHMYHPWSDGLRSFIVNCQRSPSRSTTEIRGLRVITLASIVKMVWVRTLIHDIWNFDVTYLLT